MFNRLGALNINGMMYALRRDVVDKTTGLPEAAGGTLMAGKVTLRPDKRPRPIVLRMRVGDCLTVNFTNLLSSVANPFNAAIPELQIDDQVADRMTGFHPLGMELVGTVGSSATFAGNNASSLVAPGQSTSYTFYANAEGSHLVVSHGAVFGGEASGGNISMGLFGGLMVEPANALFYRSMVTNEEMDLAAAGNTPAPGGQPVVDYEATYPMAEPWITEGNAGLPILNMLTPDLEIVHSDVNAIISGPNADGSFPASTYPLESRGLRNPTYPNRLESFREFASIWHDETTNAQAFPAWFNDPVLGHTLHGVRDSFMINYGSGGVGAEIIANRLGVGPMHDCLSCAYEEFFLTGFAVGDAGQLVDIPANAGLEACNPALQNCDAVGPKATMALYPDDPANVHHSYIGDFVKFRNIHAGPKEHHVFHLHNHQWLYNPNDDNSNYIDAQGLGPGSGYTYEIAFGGSGNRNKSAGDAIFHCHFYPHFAQGMWYMWRNHDTFEAGTELAASNGSTHTQPFALLDGTPAPGARAYPDGEIIAGIGQPAVVPLPGKALAPMPGRVTIVAQDNNGDGIPESSQALIDRTDTDVALIDPELNPTGLKNPGFPFWIAGIEQIVGQRPPTPPLDMLASAGGWDGGLPRHAIGGLSAGGVAISTQSRLDFSKVLEVAAPFFYPEEGTDVERAVMSFHSKRNHASFAPNRDGTLVAANFVTNGQKPQAGAPYHEPCIDDEGDLILTGQQGDFFGASGLSTKGVPVYGADNPRVYKAAVIQTDVVFNKVGYHFPQQRIITLNEDVAPTLDKTRPPEPFVMRLNTYDCARFQHTNLVPEVYELDDYQVRTPTDIIGQHIHLPKWDLTSADGSANGWNYEDGTLSPGAVQERIHAINAWADLNAPGTPHLEAVPHPFFGAGPDGHWLGARTTIQRWFADPMVNVDGYDRGLGIIFTHDHFGPSTHQQVGLYATMLIEPANSQWVHNETGVPLNTRDDGGPTSWQAAILTGDLDGDGLDDSFREFYFEYSDFQHAYQPGVFVGIGPDGGIVAPTAETFRDAVNPSVRVEVAYPDLQQWPTVCPGGVPRPCPEAISAEDPGMLVVNYRNEPIAHRVYDPAKIGPDGKPGMQADGLAGDLAFALQTRTDRKIAALNTALGNTPYAPITGDTRPGDPFTPMPRALDGDVVKIKMQAGGQEEEHSITVHGVKWLQAGSGHGEAPNSGWRNQQAAGISEQFTFSTPITGDLGQRGPVADYLYSPDSSMDGWWNGMWGVVRSYKTSQANLFTLPSNVRNNPLLIANKSDFNGVCPLAAPVRAYDLTAVLANDVLGNPGVTIVPADETATQHVGGPLNPNGGTLVYNSRSTMLSNGKSGPLHDPTGMMFVETGNLQVVPGQSGCKGGSAVTRAQCKVELKPGISPEPVVLRAAAGDCISVTVRNRLPATAPDLASDTMLWPILMRDRNDPNGPTYFQNNLIRPSSNVGIRPQLVEYDVTAADGSNVGINPTQTVAPGNERQYNWYAGDLQLDVRFGKGANGRSKRFVAIVGDFHNIVATPVEFGGTNLIPADKIKQGQKGLVGSLIVEPQGSTWVEDPNGRAAALVTKADGSSFRDFAVVLQEGLAHRYADGSAVENLADADDSQDSGHIGVNYRTEPLWFRFGLAADTPFNGAHGGAGLALSDIPDAHRALSNSLVGGDPETPVFTVQAGTEARMRVGVANGTSRGRVFTVGGHNWQRDPYIEGTVPSQTIGHNPLGMTFSAQDSVNPSAHFDMVMESAGGTFLVDGDYVYRDQASFGITGGMWGLLRVTPAPDPGGTTPGGGGGTGGGGGGGGGGNPNKGGGKK